MTPEPKNQIVRAIYKPSGWDKSHLKIDLSDVGVDSMRKKEWILTNGLGGYCSQSVSGENTRPEHGLLVSASPKLKKTIFLKRFYENAILDGSAISLDSNEHEMSMTFNLGLEFARYSYSHKKFSVKKTFRLIKGYNALLTTYEIQNPSNQEIKFEVHPYYPTHKTGEPSKSENNFSLIKDKAFTVSDKCGCMLTYSYDSTVKARKKPGVKSEKYLYGKKSEEITSHALLEYEFKPKETKTVSILTVGCETRDETKKTFERINSKDRNPPSGIIGDEFGTEIMSLLSSARSLLVDFDGKKTILPGYHDIPPSTRSTMISLPGVCFISKDFNSAEKIFELVLNKVWGGKVPANPAEKKSFSEFDAGLWLIARLYQYTLLIDSEKANSFIHTYWWTLKEILKYYSDHERQGVLKVKEGGWIPEKRVNAIEIQGLWYNCLNVMEHLSTLMEDDLSLKTDISESKKAIDELYWNGSYLNDCEGSESLTPNQLIVLSMDYCPIGKVCAIKILKSCERKLLTPLGIRTLPQDDSGYIGDGKTPFQGSAHPWLLGPFLKAYSKFIGMEKIPNILHEFMTETTSTGCLGTISEYYSGDKPYKPLGHPCWAPSVAEPLRAYFEDVLVKK